MSDYRDEVSTLRKQIVIIRQRLQLQGVQQAQFGLYCPTHMAVELAGDFAKLREAFLSLLRYELDPIFAEEQHIEIKWLQHIYRILN